jgi:hypothetical protein
VTDKHGNVEMIGDKKMITDINAMNSYSSKIILPDISNVETKRKPKVRVLYGQQDFTVIEKVQLVQKTFLVLLKDTLLWMARSEAMSNFPINGSQITSCQRGKI